MRRALLALLLLALPGCKPEMTQQKRLDTYGNTSAWPGGAARTLPEGTVARGELARQAAGATPPPVDAALLARGQERYAIFCTPCHGAAGEGDGMIVRRGFPAPPSYHIARLRAAPARHFFDVITNGYGVMYSYADRVEPADRWAIAAYIRALQLSRHARVAEVPGLAEQLP
ncbi:cytochrome c [Pseudoroseomonas wenyumeiae]|uniref:Cytochrome c n=1 Tax=Teichococcus wenyumeiae TaxID=2478470 RepID=A0A3A9J483_9PROT|nr:cytochrome c [Pseudoroseomonas wenyumeiae]RKK01262.1 cytochrome c [Pseudoroseomonas wenyumeiae]RMI24553.1 cytochrome c [Pseudoroseomonas wenyumeiae]